MRRPAVLTFISRKRRRATRRAIFASSTSSHTMSVPSLDPDTMRPFDWTATHRTCARRGVDERSTRGLTGRRRRTESMCPRSVWRHRSLDASHTLSVLSPDPDTMLPFKRTATLRTCARRGVDEQSTRCVDWTPAPRRARVPGQRPEAPTARRVPHLEFVVARPGHDVAVREGGDAPDLRPSRCRRAIDARFDWTPVPRRASVPA